MRKLTERLSGQQGMFTKARSDNEKAVRLSCLLSQKIAEKMKPYSDGEFLKESLSLVAAEMCPNMAKEFDKISLSRWTVARRIDSLAEDICETLKDKVKNFISWSFATDESTDRRDTAQLAIFVKGVDQNLNETEELLSLQSMKDTTTGNELLGEVCEALDKFGLDNNSNCVEWQQTVCGLCQALAVDWLDG